MEEPGATSLLDLLDTLIEITTEQLMAARKLDGNGLAEANRKRSDVLFEMQIALQEDLTVSVKRSLQQKLPELARLEDRLARVSSSVLHSINALVPDQRNLTYRQIGRRQTG